MRNLTLNDSTQKSIIEHLKVTEKLLSRASTLASGKLKEAEVIALPDLGMPHNVRRVHGGFFTGALYRWESDIPIFPIDSTMNVDNVSVYRLNAPISSKEEFIKKIEKSIKNRGSYEWNFDVGNHFVTYGSVSESTTLKNGNYLVLHGSASEFKNQHNGLYPFIKNWYSNEYKIIWHEDNIRYLRYIEGKIAERFFGISKMLEEYNKIRHQYFASSICEDNYIEEVINLLHYGMPSVNSVAIGCQWFDRSSLFLLLTTPQKPLYFIESVEDSQNSTAIENKNISLYPHGLGKQSLQPLMINYAEKSLCVNRNNFALNESLQEERSLALRELDELDVDDCGLPRQIKLILEKCPGKVVGVLQPIFSYGRYGFL
jgi:hypothetical protein